MKSATHGSWKLWHAHRSQDTRTFSRPEVGPRPQQRDHTRDDDEPTAAIEEVPRGQRQVPCDRLQEVIKW